MKNKENREYMDCCYSNFDHSFENGLEPTTKMIQENPNNHFHHAGWNFSGNIWFEDGFFYEEVWVYRIHQQTLKNEVLSNLIEEVNDQYGYD